MTSKLWKNGLSVFLVALMSVATLTGCQTMEGAGEDIENAGEEIDEAID